MYRSAALLCLLLLIVSCSVTAQTRIHHCIGANGGAVFTDQPCAALQATPITPRASQSTATVSTPPPTLCAASTQALRQSVIDAFAARNANRLAGLMLWNGYGRRSVIADIRSLHALMKRPLLDIELTADQPDDPAPATADLGGISANPFATDAPVAAPPEPRAADQLVLHTASRDGLGMAQERRFEVVRRSGCLWLRRLD